MKLYVSILAKLIELPECSLDAPQSSPLRLLLDDLGLEVKGVEVTQGSNGAREAVFTIETLANRGDHLSALGVAREISARTLTKITLPAIASTLPERRSAVPLKRSTDLCSRYSLLEMSLPADMPLRADVAQVTEQPGKHHPIVDLLNYVQREVGQPMHAFDFDKIDGELIVAQTVQLESIEALDGEKYSVPVGSIVIRDRKKIVAVAGVIGCSNSMVTATTTKILVEAAVFDPVSVRITAKAMGLGTDASHAFERGVDPEGVQFALKRLIHLSGGSAGAVGGSDSAHPLGYTQSDASPLEKRKLSVPLSVMRKQLNLLRLDETEISVRLKSLGYGVELSSEGKDKIFNLVVPSWRLLDVSDTGDIIEDIARSVSFSRIKPEVPQLTLERPAANFNEVVFNKIRSVVIGSGFIEVISKGFYSQSEVAVLEKLSPRYSERHATIKNALEQSNSHLKRTNIIHLTKILSDNLKRGVVAPKIFERARVFELPIEQVDFTPRTRHELDYDFERDFFCFASAGRWKAEEFRKAETFEEVVRQFNGVLSNLVTALGGEFSIGKSDQPFFHPGIRGSVKIGRQICGSFGAVHPDIADYCGLKERAIYAELDLRVLYEGIKEKAAPSVSEFPAIKRDLTLKIEVGDQAGRVSRLVNESQIDQLIQVLIVDDFKRDSEAFRRVTYRLKFQSLEKTLQHEQVDAAVAELLGRLKEKYGIVLAE